MSESGAPKATSTEAGDIYPHEVWWRDHQPWLKDQGYILRDRYQPDWVPSWKQDPTKYWGDTEDGVMATAYNFMDAVRRDGTFVALKQIRASKTPHEIEIARLFSSKPLSDDPNNYCLPILDVLQAPDDSDLKIIVMPLLYYHDAAKLETIGEGVEVVRQLFEGLNFMHQNNVAHRDCKYNNIMGDLQPLFDMPPHPAWNFLRRDFKTVPKIVSSRTAKPVKYFLLDFGLSKVYKPEDAPHLEPGGFGGDRTVPEFLEGNDTLCNPFQVDVYCMGNLIRALFTEGSDDFPRILGFEFLRELVNDMVQDDPAKRPTMKEVVTRYSDIVKTLGEVKLRSRVALASEGPARKVIRSIGHWMKQIMFMIKRVPAIPKA